MFYIKVTTVVRMATLSKYVSSQVSFCIVTIDQYKGWLFTTIYTSGENSLELI
jgi:hypothetical protein